ncbi:MAG: UbiX family flavin prenyltransferase [Streptosporangiales bacterium]|nr:UbiX family flavin prenyltransferase [Streptosporangiales bacterium]MBO0891402.1 UbiX family flavin prenyltransferase [Acidothermales bacterium]
MRIVVGLSGASGVAYGIRLLEVLRTVPDVETHLIVSPAAKQTMTYETDRTLREVVDLADYSYSFRDIAAAPSSGSFRTAGMVICPCSMRTLSGVATSSDSDLLVRAADVVLKERRRLVLVPRETPLHLGHLRLMVQATEIGAVIAPPVPAFYSRPQSIDDIVDHTVYRVLDLFDIDVPDEVIRRWEGIRTEPDQRIGVVRDARLRSLEGST